MTFIFGELWWIQYSDNISSCHFLWTSWSKERRVVLVSSIERKKWTTVRTLPTKKPIPAQFEVGVICLFHAKKNKMALLFNMNRNVCYLYCHCLLNNCYSCMFADLYARGNWQKVSVHWKLLLCSQHRRERPVDLHER